MDWTDLELERDRDLAGRGRHQWIRRIVLALLTLFILAALLNTFGQRPTTTEAHTRFVSLQVVAPERLRGGLYFQARFRFSSLAGIARPMLVLDSGWIEAMTLNTTEPSAAAENIRNGKLQFSFPPVGPGKQFTFWTEWQPNPTDVGLHHEGVWLYDGGRLLAHVNRSAFVFP